jgi:hypothetical protein
MKTAAGKKRSREEAAGSAGVKDRFGRPERGE